MTLSLTIFPDTYFSMTSFTLANVFLRRQPDYESQISGGTAVPHGSWQLQVQCLCKSLYNTHINPITPPGSPYANTFQTGHNRS